MGQLGPNHLEGENGPLFTGDDPSYPVELLIYVVENEASYINESEDKMCKVAWDLIDQDKSTKAGDYYDTIGF